MEARATQRFIRQSPRKMRLVMDLIRGLDVNDAYGILKHSKKGAARQIEKVLRSAVANAEHRALEEERAVDVDKLVVEFGIVNEGPTYHRWRPAAHGRAVPIKKRTSHVEIRVALKEAQ